MTPIVHGHARKGRKTKIYQIWISMKDRCYCKTDHAYHNYGARGIYICDEWKNNFAQFFADMGNRPAGMCLDRIDNDGPYSPENCQWAPISKQTWNQRKTKLLTFRGKTKPMTVWNRELGFGGGTVRLRLLKGMSTEQALTSPSKGRGHG